MKIGFIFCVFFIGVSFADYPWPSNTFAHDKYGQHYEQHKESVSAAKKVVHDWLSQQGVTESNNIEPVSGNLEVTTDGAGGLDAYNGGGLCTVPCESSQVATSSNDAETFGSSDIGVGYVGFPNGGGNSDSSSSNYASQSEYSQTAAAAPILIPSGGSNSRYSSSSRQHSERVSQQAPIPIVVPSSGGSSERYSSHSEHVSETQAAQPVHIVVPSGGNSQRYTSRSERISERQSAAQPQIIYHPTSTGHSDRFSSHSERSSESNKAVPIPVQLYGGDNGSERYALRSDQITERRENTPAIIPYPQPASRSRYQQQRSELSETQQTVAPQYIPVYPPRGSSERYRSNSESYSSRSNAAAPIPVYTQPRTLASDRYSEHSESVQERQEPQLYPVYPVTGGGSSSRYSSSRQESSRQQHAAQPAIIIPAAQRSASSSRYSQNEESSSQNVQQPQYYQPLIPTGGSSSRYGLNENYESNSQQAGGYIPRYNSFPSDGHSSGGGAAYRGSNRMGTSLFTDHASQGLSSYMSESERLARLQAQSVQGGGAYSGSSTVNSDFGGQNNDLGSGISGGGGVGTASLGSDAGLGGAAFVRTKQWENNSKWASGTEYDENGKPKSYSRLSTGESELHNVNGKTSGYKAATTTLENDGKVSTYSIRTP